MQVLIQRDPQSAGSNTQKEAGLICEVATLVAMGKHRHVLLDGSLRNASWYRQYFSYLRSIHPQYKLSILHVVASAETIFERARKRGERTGRVIPRDALEQSMREVPRSVDELEPLVDYVVTIENDHGQLRLLNGASSFLQFSEFFGLCETLGPSCENADCDCLQDLAHRHTERQ